MLHSRKKFLSTVFGSMIAATSLLTAGTSTANTRHEVSNLVRVAESLADAAQTVRANACAARTIRLAYYEIRQASWELQGFASTTASHALNVAAEKLNDRYLSQQEKIFFALDCLGVALKSLIPDTFHGELAARRLLEAASAIGKGYAHDKSVNLLKIARRILRNMCPVTYRRSINAIEVAIEKAEDRFLTNADKAYFIDDCVKVALRNL